MCPPLAQFQICDRNKNGTLDLDEFAKCVTLCKLGLSAEAIGKLHAHFDADHSGAIDYEEFLHACRGPLSASRKQLVLNAFHALDAQGDGNGVLTVEDLSGLYDASKHPDVVSGRIDGGSALRAFLDGFEGANGNRDGLVTINEWVKYYERISASIDSDDYFGQMMASTWGGLKAPSGKAALSYVSTKEIDRLERLLFEASYRRKGGSAHSQERLLNEAFKLFDKDGSGAVDKAEFLKAMERFGLHVRGKGRPGIGGFPEAVVLGLFDRYDQDGSGTLSFREFSSAFLVRHQETDSGIPADEYNTAKKPADPTDDTTLRHPKKKHDHELQAARQATGLSSKGYAGYLSQAVKVQNKESGHATAFRP